MHFIDFIGQNIQWFNWSKDQNFSFFISKTLRVEVSDKLKPDVRLRSLSLNNFVQIHWPKRYF